MGGRIKRLLRLAYDKVFYAFNRLIPKSPRRVLFLDRLFRQDSSWALALFLSDRPDLRLDYFCAGARPAGLPARVRWCRGRIGATWLFLRAGFVFFTHAPLEPFVRPAGRQRVVNLWHGTAMKLVTFPKSVIPVGASFTDVISAAPAVDELMTGSFSCSRDKVLSGGYPRNDWLFSNREVFSPLGIDRAGFARVALWMPTFRTSSTLGVRDSDRDIPVLTPDALPALHEKLAELNILLLLKPHPASDLAALADRRYTHFRTVTGEDFQRAGVQTYEFLAQCDLLLTDYSSVYFDFLLTGKPIAFVFDDMDAYGDRRGFFHKDPEAIMPGDKIHDIGELTDFFERFANGADDWGEQRAAVRDRFNACRDAGNCARLTEKLGVGHGR